MSAPRTVMVGITQMTTSPRSYQQNLERAQALVVRAATEGADVVVLPELFLHGHGYACDRNAERESITGPTAQWMSDITRRHGIMLVGGINERIEGNEKCHSTLLLVDRGALLGCYRKQNPACAEHLFMRAGGTPGIFDTRLGKLALLTCFDMSFPQCVADIFHAAPDLLLISNAWVEMGNMPYLRGAQYEHHTLLPRAIAMQLRVPVATSNLVGATDMIVPCLPEYGSYAIEFETEFAGGSLVCDHFGSVLTRIENTQENECAVVEVNCDEARSLRRVLFDLEGLDAVREQIGLSSL